MGLLSLTSNPFNGVSILRAVASFFRSKPLELKLLESKRAKLETQVWRASG